MYGEPVKKFDINELTSLHFKLKKPQNSIKRRCLSSLTSYFPFEFFHLTCREFKMGLGVFVLSLVLTYVYVLNEFVMLT